jgi:hypothetical protein
VVAITVVVEALVDIDHLYQAKHRAAHRALNQLLP